jgi:hypothetical protein
MDTVEIQIFGIRAKAAKLAKENYRTFAFFARQQFHLEV